MIATGNHHFEKFAALCNTLPGEPRRLRRTGRQVVDPYVAHAIVVPGRKISLTKPENGDILLTETRNYTFKCRREPEGCRGRIVNPVEIRNGTATVSVEVSAQDESRSLGN